MKDLVITAVNNYGWPQIFDTKTGLVMTPDGNKPFVLVHQYNRAGDWTARIHAKYREW